VLVYFRRIDGKIDRLTDDVQDLKHRVTSLEGQVASIRGDMAAMSLRIGSKPGSTGSSGGSISLNRRPANRPFLFRPRAEIAGLRTVSQLQSEAADPDKPPAFCVTSCKAWLYITNW